MEHVYFDAGTRIQQKFSENFKNIPPSFIRQILNMAGNTNLISFAGGLPNPRYFPSEWIGESAKAVMEEKGMEIMQYAGSMGYLPLRQWISDRYNAKYGLNISPDNVVITNGSQQTIDVLAKMLLNAGDTLIVEKPTYLGGIQATAGYLPNYHAIDLDEEGANLDQLEQICKTGSPKFFYGIPNYQNPSGICYSPATRARLGTLLKKYDLLMLEDDPYHEITFRSETVAPIYQHAPGNVFWSGSFSKMVAPGLRMGWVVIPEGFTNHFVKAKQSTDLHSSNLTQYLLHHFLTHHDIDVHLQKIRKAYNEQCNTMLEMLKRFLPEDVQFTKPCGGMFIWLTLPEGFDSEELVKVCINRGVVFVPGKSFYVNGDGKRNIRMNFSNSTPEEIERGVYIMGKAMQQFK
jgi:2-aminoadipate transaminase